MVVGCVSSHSTAKSLRTRRGVSPLEFIGCLAAVVGGAVIGSMYLGVDIQGAAVKLMRLSASNSSVPAQAASADNSAPAPKVSIAAAKPEVKVPSDVNVHEEPAPASVEVTAAESNPIRAFTEAIELTDDQRHSLTKAYWTALNECMTSEVENRTAGLRTGADWELYDYLSARSEGHEKAATVIGQLEAHGVDGHVSAYGEKALAWHKEGAKLYARARDLLTDAPTAQLSGPLAQSWQSAATQHQMEERLLGEKRDAVQSYLEHQNYDLVKPATPAAK